MSSIRDELPASEDKLKSLSRDELLTICGELGISIDKGLLRQKIIKLILEKTGDSAGASARADTSMMSFIRSAAAKPDGARGEVQALGAEEGGMEEEGGTPTTATSKQRVADFGKKGIVWFDTSFLEGALNERLGISSGKVGQANPTPTLFILVGPASVGKSSAKRLIPEMNGYVLNIDVDDIKLYGNDVLPKHTSKKNPDEMLSDVEGIQFKYDLVLEKLRPMVFQNATKFGEGNYKNIILDTTGSMSDQIKMYIRTAKRTYNYTVKFIIVYSDKIQCLQRVTVRNRELFAKGQGTRYIPPRVVSSMYDTFLKKNQAGLYAMSDRMVELTDELILVDNRSAEPKIVARRTSSALQIVQDVTDEHPIVGVDGAFYGLTLHPSGGYQPASIVQGDIKAQINKAEHEWEIFDEAEKRAKEERAARAARAAEGSGSIGGSRKRRISRRRIHGSRARKTVKKYSRHVTRRDRRRHRRH